MKEGVSIPNVTFKTRVRDEAVGGDTNGKGYYAAVWKN